ncbi:HAD family hydrolase [Modestobacter sp. VKM Ac-2978]|uniref:HAD hydrolase family protein n=1 Tax=Modestobacter sp. VKM Ac-2978 TaxID=3004132 RepID=UPI0022AA6789|nr:HAD family hydrolase [Modestobacter sp. VKM Ac-2978]MCZ2849825.1 HAD family hydrolase [Modestobacter sp. VKM Ac-2978]
MTADRTPAARPRPVFIDLDGTLMDAAGQIPASAVAAIEAARSAGHPVLLCTGRSLPEIPDHALEIGFDGLIASSGGFVRSPSGRVLRHLTFPPDLLRDVVRHLDGVGAEHFLETNGGTYATTRVVDLVSERLGVPVSTSPLGGRSDVPGEVLEAAGAHGVNKVSFFGSTAPVAEVAGFLDGRAEVVAGSISGLPPAAGEISPLGVTKAAGIRVLLDHVGGSPADSVAFGDGPNDVSMFAFVGTAVAMGGSHPLALSATPHMTTAIDDDGLARGFAAVGLIDGPRNGSDLRRRA